MLCSLLNELLRTTDKLNWSGFQPFELMAAARKYSCLAPRLLPVQSCGLIIKVRFAVFQAQFNPLVPRGQKIKNPPISFKLTFIRLICQGNNFDTHYCEL